MVRCRFNSQDTFFCTNSPSQSQILTQGAFEFLVHGRIVHRISEINLIVKIFVSQNIKIKCEDTEAKKNISTNLKPKEQHKQGN